MLKIQIPSLNLSIYQGILFVVSIAIFLTIISYFSKHKEIKEQESQLSYTDTLILYGNRLYHYSSTIIIMFFPYIFKSEIIQNSFYLLYLLFVYLSWRMYKECPISIIEKTILDNTYKMGDKIYYEPYTTLIFHPKNENDFKMLQNSIIIMYYVNLIIIGYQELYLLYMYTK